MSIKEPNDDGIDFPLIEWAVKNYRDGAIVQVELRHFLLKGLRLKFVGDTILIGSYCGWPDGKPVEENK